ncbi:MAG: CoA-binding protein [Hyphomicrobiaceae bacterium]
MPQTRQSDEVYDDELIRKVLEETRTIAMVGASANTVRPSYFAFKYLLAKGYRMIPVNPGVAGKEILGQTVYASLREIPEPVDMVDVFRGSDAALDITKDAIAIGARVVWMQLGVCNKKAAKLARKAGMIVIMNRCPKIEYGRLSGEIGWVGVNSGTISAKRGKLMKGFQHRKLA